MKTTLAAAVRWNETLMALWADERKAVAAFLSALAEFDAKRGWEVLGYSGLFRYLTQGLGTSEGLAYSRMQGVKVVRACPEVLPYRRRWAAGGARSGQVDHVLPKARGGDSTADNLRLLCRRHNLQAAQAVFGEAWVQQRAGREGG